MPKNVVLDVPEDTPLAKFGVEVWVIWSADGPAGVYPSLERALQYMKSWLDACDPPEPITSVTKINDATYRVQVTNLVDPHEIHRTDIRI